MSVAVIRLCTLCEDADPGMADALAEALEKTGQTATIDTAECMSGCTRGPTLSVRASGKTAYLFGDTGPRDIPDLITFLKLYTASQDGDLTDARPIGQLRFKAIARIPAGKS